MSAAKAIFNVTVSSGRGETEKTLQGESLSVGRAPDCTVRIHNDNISRKHLTFVCKNGQLWMEDHGSANGTYLNGTKVKAHMLVSISASDEIRLGNSDIQLHVRMTPVEEEAGVAPPSSAPPGPDPTRADTVIMAPGLVAPPAITEKSQEDHRADQLVKEAQKKSTQIIFEAESLAEKRVQEIYSRAHDTQKKAENFYRQRLQEAFEESQKSLQDAQERGREFLAEARRKAQDIRDEVESFVAQLRSRSESECASLLEEAEARGRELKDQRIREAESQIHDKEAELLAAVRQETEEERNKKILELDEYIHDTRAAHDNQLAVERLDHDAQITALREKIDLLNEQLRLSEEEARRRIDDFHYKVQSAEEEWEKQKTIQSEQEAELAKIQSDLHETREKLLQNQTQSRELEQKLQTQQQEEQQHQRQLQKHKEELGRLSLELRTYAEKVEGAKKESAAEIIRLKEKHEQERGKIEKTEEEKAHQLRLEATQQVRKLERDLLAELHGKKDRLSREILLSVEAQLKEHLPTQGWSEISAALQEQVASILSGQIVTISKDSAMGDKKKQLISERKKERWTFSGMGLVFGALLLLLGQSLWVKVKTNKSPLRQIAQEEAQSQQRDLEARRFNPPQVAELKDTYTDSVLYTRDFVSIYLEPAYQKRWFAAAGSYLMKTWRLDEDHSIQTLSTAAALVKNLYERRQKIHPDFVTEGVAKMREIENENLARMRDTLGSQVRLESFKKFEKEFFEQEVLQRSAPRR